MSPIKTADERLKDDAADHAVIETNKPTIAKYYAMIEENAELRARIAELEKAPSVADKAAYWFNRLQLIVQLLEMPDDQPITSAPEVLEKRLAEYTERIKQIEQEVDKQVKAGYQLVLDIGYLRNRVKDKQKELDATNEELAEAKAALAAQAQQEPTAWLVRERSKKTGLLSNEILVKSRNHFRESEHFKYEFVPLYSLPPAPEGE